MEFNVQPNCTDCCAIYREVTDLRLVILSIASLISILGFASNLTLTHLFLRVKNMEPTLAFLALLDCLLCVSYFLLFGVEAYAYYWKLKFMYDALFLYTIPVLVMSRIVQLCIPFVLILTSIHTWIITTNRQWRLFQSNVGRVTICLVILIIATSSRLSTFAALEVHYYINCTNYFLSQEIWPTVFGDTKSYTNYDWGLTTIQVFVPLVILVIVNVAVLLEMRRQRKQQQRSVQRQILRLKGKQVMNGNVMELVSLIHVRRTSPLFEVIRIAAVSEKAAMHTMGIIVATYLSCNSIHSVLTILENSAPMLLNEQDGWSTLYLWACDAVSFLFMFSSAIRLVIYYYYNPSVRFELQLIIKRKQKRNGDASLLPTLVIGDIEENNGYFSIPTQNNQTTQL